MKKNIYNILQIIARRASRHRLLQAFRLLCPVHCYLSFRLLPAVLLSTVPYATVYASTGLGFILEPVTVNDVPAAVMDVAQVESVPAASVLADAVAKPVVVSQPKPMVKKEKVTIYERDILDALAEALYGRYHLDGELRVSLQRKWKPVKAASHDWLLQINELPVDGVKSSIILKFEVIEGNITIGQWQLPLRCELWKEVLTSTRRIANGVEPLASDFNTQNVNVLRLKDNPVPLDLDLSDYVMKQAIGNGQALLWQNIEPKPLVRKGQLVEVIANEGALHISMKGVALEDGLVNEFISIRNLTSKKSFDAQIMDEKHVKVYF